MAIANPITEGEILERIIATKEATLSPEAARSLLELQFPSQDTNHIRKLLRKNNGGTITAPERIALERYLRVGQLLDLLHAKARLSLAKRSRTQ
jgi:hypothetical protein